MKNKKTTFNIFIPFLVIFFILLATFSISQLRLEFLKNYQNRQVTLTKDELWHDKRNEELKEFTLRVSPNQKKQVYFQRKFSKDNVTDIDDNDYISVILNQGNKKEVILQGNFKLSYVEWLNNDEVKIYKGCGSSCLLSYVVNTNTKEVNEYVEKVIELNL